MKTVSGSHLRCWMLAIASVMMLALTACGGEDGEGGGGGTDCALGQTVACFCADGAEGTATCLNEGATTDCVCTGAPGDTGDVIRDVVEDGETGGTDTDVDPPDAGNDGGTDGGTDAGNDGGGTDAEPDTTPPFETNCSDGIDEDRDSRTDCEDSDCAAADECRSPPALVAYLAKSGSFDKLMLASTDGSVGPIQIEAEEQALQQSPAFSPDGRLLAYGYAGFSGSELRILNLETGETDTVVVAGMSRHIQPNFSDDNALVAFMAGPASAPNQVYVYDLENESLSGPLTNVVAPEFAAAPVFNPDASQLYYLTGRGGSGADAFGDVWTMDVDGSNKTQLTSGTIFVGRLMPSPDRATLLGEQLSGSIVTVDAATGTIGGLPGVGQDAGPDYLFANRYVMASGPTGNRDIIVRDRTGVQLGFVTQTPSEADSLPAGSPVALDAFPLANSLVGEEGSGEGM